MASHKPTFMGRLSITLLVVIFGVPAAYLLIVGTLGWVLVPVIVAVYATPLFLLHYLVWGRAFSQQLRDEAEVNVGFQDPIQDSTNESG